LLVAAGPAAGLMEDGRLRPIIWVLAVGCLLGGFENVGVIEFRKSLAFKKDFVFLLSGRLVPLRLASFPTFSLPRLLGLLGRGPGGARRPGGVELPLSPLSSEIPARSLAGDFEVFVVAARGERPQFRLRQDRQFLHRQAPWLVRPRPLRDGLRNLEPRNYRA